MIISRLFLCSLLALCTSSEILRNRPYYPTAPNSKYHHEKIPTDSEALLPYDYNGIQPVQNYNPYYLQNILNSRVKRGVKLSSGSRGTRTRSSSIATRPPRSNSLPNLGSRPQTTGSIGIGTGRRNSLPVSGTGGLGPLSPTKPTAKPFNTGITSSIPDTRPPTPTTGGSFNSHLTPINYGQQNKPLFGMDVSSSSPSSVSSPRSPLNQIPSPSGSRVPSRRGSFGIEDEFEAWGGINPKTREQLERFDTWETRHTNNHNLNQNCYFCTASGLAGRDTNRMVQQTETMQQRTGTAAETVDLLQGDFPQASHLRFQTFDKMENYFRSRVPPGTAQKFGLGYQHNTGGGGGGPGHMVGLKVWQTTDGQIGAREVDFQKYPQNRFTPGPHLNNYRPSGPGPFDLIDIWHHSLQHSKRTTDNNVLPEEHSSKRLRNTDIGR